MENKLSFLTPAAAFEEAFPIGCGRIGAMVYGNCGKEKISLNEDTLWSGTGEDNPVPENASMIFNEIRTLVAQGRRDEAVEKSLEFTSSNTASFLPLGNVFFSFNHKNISDYMRELDLSNGIVSVSYGSDGIKYKREIFASYPKQCIAFSVSSDCSGSISFDIDFDFTLDITKSVVSDDIIYFKGRCPYIVKSSDYITGEYIYNDAKETISFTNAFKIVTVGGTKEFCGNTVKIRNADSAYVYIFIETSFDGIDKPFKDHTRLCLERAENELVYNAVKSEHIKDFNRLYSGVSLSLDSACINAPSDERIKHFDGSDTGLYELLFNFGRYLMISSSRKGSMATNLQGIWNENKFAPWRSNYTVNINTEMNYWPVHSANLTECFFPLLDLVKKMKITGTETAKKYYNASGFVCHHNCDLWGHTNPVGKGEPWAFAYAFWNMSSGWLACQLYDAYAYTMDIELLKNEIYPIMKSAAEFYIDIMTKDSRGKYIVSPATSPENTYVFGNKSYAADVTSAMTISIIYELLSKLIRCCDILNTDADFKNRLKEITANLRPLEIGSDGRLLEWCEQYEEKEIQHRHISHLYGLYPGDSITVEKTPDLAEACRKSLAARGDVGTGWSLAWKVNSWARLKDGNHALKVLSRQLKYVDPLKPIDYVNGGGTYPNMFDAHPPFQIDGNFGVVSGIIEMLIYSTEGSIEILPALPDKFKNGKIEGVIAKGGIEVSVFWKNSKTYKVKLKSSNDRKCTLKANEKKNELDLKANKVYTIDYDL